MFAHTQQTTCELLDRAVKRQRLSHALLFTGLDTRSMEEVLQKLAAHLLCQGLQPTQEPLSACEKCSACIRIKANIHPNLRRVETEGNEIRVEQIRELRSQQRMSSFEEGAQLWVIPKAHTLNAHASNALLKTLEEPYADRYLILMAPSQSVVLETLVSRCQIVRFLPPQIPEEMPEVIQNQASKIVTDLPKLSVTQRLSLAESLAKQKEELPELLNGMLVHLLRDVAGQPFDRRISQRQAATAVETVLTGIRRHLNVQLLLETLFLQDWPA